jgi:hemerythrin-like metal-binding protein
VTPKEHVDRIVHDHAEIADLVARLRSALNRGDQAEMKSLLMALQMLEAKHYATEDALMRAVGYDQADTHRAEHATMLETLKRINEALVWENLATVSPQVVAHLEAAVAHMIDADQTLNRFVAGNAGLAAG